MDVNISKEGMTRDLEAMKESGIGGLYIFNADGVWTAPYRLNVTKYLKEGENTL
jgi:hypothetical protein